jgi:hypothetical protein
MIWRSRCQCGPESLSCNGRGSRRKRLIDSLTELQRAHAALKRSYMYLAEADSALASSFLARDADAQAGEG